MLKELIKTKEWIIDILLPKKCIGCEREGLYICKDCELFISEASNLFESEPRTMSVWEYEGIIEKAILKIKYSGHYDIINELVDKAFEKIELNLPADTYITYVPMYKKREREGGFNQAELIARRVGEITNKEVLALLIKIKDNRSQTDLNPQERIENVRNAFAPLPIKVKPRSILLVDDVYSTGATIRECIRTLKLSGIENISSFTLAREFSRRNII